MSFLSGLGSFLGDTLLPAFGGVSGIGQAFGIKELARVGQPAAPAISSQGAQALVPGGGAGFGVAAIGAPGPAAGGGGFNNVTGTQFMTPSAIGQPGLFVDVPKAAADRFAGMATQRLDIITASQPDDREIAKLAIQQGAVVPADSDLGIAMQMGGAKPHQRRVKFSDGTTRTIMVVGAKKRRRRRNYATKAGIRNAARTLKQMGQHIRTYDKLAKLGAQIDRKLHPKRGGPCKAVRTTRCRKR